MRKIRSDIKNRIGEKFTTNEGYRIEIIEYFNKKNSTIKFEDGLIKTNISFQNIKNGNIGNPFHKSVYGIGYLGIGVIDNKIRKIWDAILQRCYDKEHQLKVPTYIGCSICNEWLNYQNFAKWFNENYIEDYCLDKDILIKGNKIYSPNTCCFVPPEINTLFTKRQLHRGNYPIGVTYHKANGYFVCQINKGKIRERYFGFDCHIKCFNKYKEVKEKYIKEVADKYKSTITKECHDAMYNYKVEIDD